MVTLKVLIFEVAASVPVSPTGVEPVVFCFVDRCFIQLSYGDIWRLYYNRRTNYLSFLLFAVKKVLWAGCAGFAGLACHCALSTLLGLVGLTGFAGPLT